jgi:hypothetical protein
MVVKIATILQVVCQVTSHEMPCTMKAVEMYINGKKYKYACEHKLTSTEEELRSEYLTEKRYKIVDNLPSVVTYNKYV